MALVSLILVVMLLAVGVGLDRWLLIETRLERTARHAVLTTSDEITDRLANLRARVAMFVHYEQDALRALYRDPSAGHRHERLLQRARAFLPGLRAFTLLSPGSDPVVDDFDGVIGEICREDVRMFLKSREERLRIHPNPFFYHFDVMVPLEIGEAAPALFLAAFDPGLISDILNEDAPMNHALLLVDPARDGLVEVTARGSRDRLPESEWHLPAEDPYLLARAPVKGTVWQLVDRIDPEYFATLRNTTALHVGLMLGGLILLSGVFLHLHRRDLANRARVARELEAANARLRGMNARLEHLAATDALTGLTNRRQFDLDLHRELERALREQRPLALLLCDLDHFKQINDRRGHREGDLCLREIAALVASHRLRDEDVIARYGGDEIVLLLPGTDCEGARRVAERLREAVETLGLEAGTGERVTLSIGVACHDPSEGPVDPEALMARADEALYRAKAAGKNRVVVGA